LSKTKDHATRFRMSGQSWLTLYPAVDRGDAHGKGAGLHFRKAAFPHHPLKFLRRMECLYGFGEIGIGEGILGDNLRDKRHYLERIELVER